MKRSGAVCPKCGSTSRPIKEKIMGQDTQDLICPDCKYTGWWTEFQPKEKSEE
ncbi:Eag protein [Vibrio parahaemolyticus]|uniref:Eag protein n=1 Tax=Vibrio diabolicus TaxID=50719 RepID=UPI000AFABF37|nr:Eag protein [Vibrio diabolicus]EHK9101370.1 Eag protein [Vibrio parahaemolyticus]NOI13487.1 Eag protein [Vibrio hepatarius]EIA1333933.1 Eag protein [Vibrio parahaemolyticus]EJE8567851.1 Eag protein [Vibrio parahaemolyticus]MBE3705498.1 Eag protein [Vibrio parahaemolyticus]